MRKFKLLKFYPSLNKDWKEGLIVIKGSDSFYRPMNAINSPGRIIPSFVENYPEYWEEITEKGYEILKIRYDNPILNQHYDLDYENDICIKSIKSGIESDASNIIKLNQFNDKDWKYTTILEIRRKSDGVKFKIGDKVCWNWNKSNNKYFTIKSFKNTKGDLIFDTIEQSVQRFSLNSMENYNFRLYENPILITEDGYECTLDDRVFGVLPKANWQTNFYGNEGISVENLVNSGDGNCTKNTAWLYFKTKENAEKYIYENKPEFSRKQVKDAIKNSKFCNISNIENTLHEDILEKLGL